LAAQGDSHNAQLTKIKKEIAILKKCRHPHVVRLKEVIDDPGADKIFMVLEYLEGGDIKWQDASDPPKPNLSIDEAREIFRDLFLGIQYRKFLLTQCTAKELFTETSNLLTFCGLLNTE
jgi:serine/threonine protein kinase